MRFVLLGNLATPHSTEQHHLQALTDLGHQVETLQEGEATAAAVVRAAAPADVLLWVHTHGRQTPGGMAPAVRELRRSRTRVVSYHLDLWHGLGREALLDDPDYYVNLVDHFFTVDPALAGHVDRRGHGNGHWLPAAVCHRECWMAPARRRDLPVVFVGSHRYHAEWPHRNRLLLALTQRYGGDFHAFPNGRPQVRGAELNRLYGRSQVVVGDSLCPGGSHEGYWSDRVYETMGRGGFIVHPRVPGLEDHFTDGQHLRLYDFDDFDGLFQVIDEHLADPAATDLIRRAGHAEVHAHHTYLHRWRHIVGVLGPP